MTTHGISIIIPTYNRAGLLPAAVASALGQPFDDLEVIVVDDGSTDDTQQVLSGMADRRLKYIYQPNQGVSAAFNAGLRASSGDLIGGLGSDDWYLPGGLVPLRRELEELPEAGLAAGGYVAVDEISGRRREARPWEQHPFLDVDTWLRTCAVLVQAALIRREWLERVNGFDEGLRSAVDWDLGLRLAQAGCRMDWVQVPVFGYRLHGGNMVRDPSGRMHDVLAVLDRYYARAASSAECQARRAQVYARAYLRIAPREYAAGQLNAAMEHVARAVELDPDLVAGKGDRLFGALEQWISDPVVGDPVEYVMSVYDHLPPSAAGLTRRRREAIARAARAALFDAHRHGDGRAVRRNLARVAAHRPGLLMDRGVASVAVHALLGAGAASHLRRSLRWLSARAAR